MIVEALEWLKEHIGPEKIGALDSVFIPRHYVRVDAYADNRQPLAEPLKLHTLDALVAYLVSDPDPDHMAMPADSHRLIEIQDPVTVNLHTALSEQPQTRERETLIVTKALAGGAFPFGQYLDQEQFVTALQTAFVRDEQVEAILKIVGTIQDGRVGTFDDDGHTQKVTVSAGITRKSEVAVPNPVVLRPYRTFPEIEQPASSYVLRLRSGRGEEPPTMALVDVVDNQWKLESVKAIRAYLSSQLEADNLRFELTILA